MRFFILVLVVLGPSHVGHAAIDGFIETFDGDGPFPAANIPDLSGFDNAGWSVFTSGVSFTEGGIDISALAQPEGEAGSILRRSVFGEGDFVARVVMTDLELSEIDDSTPPLSSIAVRVSHFLEQNSFQVGLGEFDSTPPNMWRAFGRNRDSNSSVGISVPRGINIALEYEVDASENEVWFAYDNDIHDDTPPLKFGPLRYVGGFGDRVQTEFSAIVTDTSSINGTLNHWSMTPVPGIPGDFNANEVLDIADIDLLTTEIRNSTNSTEFDLNNDSLVNTVDRDIWVHDLRVIQYGDTNMNDVFDNRDLVQVFIAGEYEDPIDGNSTWAEGDWNGDGDFTSEDIVLAFVAGGYTTSAAVPEPSALTLLGFGGLLAAIVGIER